MSTIAPPRAPLACGALGRYDEAVVERLASAMPEAVREARRDRGSILLLDREPVSWVGGGRHGLCWSENPALDGSAPRVGSWGDAAQSLAACGLVAEGHGRRGRRRVHSSVAGLAPVYWAEHAGAAYFCSRIDPLVRALPYRLTPDWRAWSAILSLRMPLGERTPFAEIRRLRPFSVLEHDGRRARTRSPGWPWAEVEPSHDAESGLGELVDALRAAVAPLRGRPASCLLSGGWDSRVLACLLAEHGNDELRCLTVNADDGTDREERHAARVAAELGLRDDAHAGDPEAWWAETRERALLCDFQRVGSARLMPLAGPLRARGAVALHGFGLDVLAQPGGRNISEAMLEPDGSRAVASALWARMREKTVAKPIGNGWAKAFGRAMSAAARKQFLREARAVRGHPAEALLTLYLTRAVRGTSLMPHAVLGAHAPVMTPFCDDRVARACLGIDPRAKFGARLYRALFEVLAPGVAAIPSTNEEDAPAERPLPQRRLSPQAARAYMQVLGDGPLTPHLAGELRDAIRAGAIERVWTQPGRQGAIAGATLFHLWHERYGDRLGDVDPAGALELGADAGGPSRAARSDRAPAGEAPIAATTE